MPIFYIVVIMCMRVVQSVYNKKANLNLPKGKLPYVGYVVLTKVLASVFAAIALLISFDFSGVNGQMLLIATCSGICLTVGTFCGIKSLAGGTVALNSLCGTAGMIIPCLLGGVFGESMTWPQWICIGALLVALVLMVLSSKSIFNGFSLTTGLCLIGSFASNGMVMFCQKLFGYYQPKGNVTMFSLLTFLIPSVLVGAIFLAMWLKDKSGKRKQAKEAGAEQSEILAPQPQSPLLPPKLYLYASFLAFAVFVIQQFVTLLTPSISAAVLFTLVNGSASVIAIIVGAVVYKEKITPKSVIGLILGVASLICIKIFE